MKTIKLATPRAVLACILFASGPSQAKTAMLLSTTPGGVGPSSIVCLGSDPSNYGLFNVDEQVSLPYGTMFTSGVYITVYSAVGSVATVAIETADTASGPWYPVTGSTPITDPSAQDAAGVGGETWWIPPTTYVRIHVTAYTSGSIHACIDGTNRINGTQVY